MEGFWSLSRFWLRPHRGISQTYLPIYLGFFEFVHNAKKTRQSFIRFAAGINYKLAPWNPVRAFYFKALFSLRILKA